MVDATFVHNGDTVLYVPAADVAAGDMIRIGSFLGIAHVPIPAGTYGALRTHGVYDVRKAADASTGVMFALGDQVFWDTTNHQAVTTSGSTTVLLGVCVEAAAKEDGHVRVRIG